MALLNRPIASKTLPGKHLLDGLPLFGVLLSLALSCTISPAQEVPEPESESQRVRGMWKAEMPAGTYLVRIDAITSVSQHEYLVEGVGRVSEVSVSAHGPAMARFYYLEPAQPQAPGGVGQSTVNFLQEKAQEAISRAGAEEVWRGVIKSYPAATHAHTVEYRLESREGLTKLFSSLERSFTSGRAGSFKP